MLSSKPPFTCNSILVEIGTPLRCNAKLIRIITVTIPANHLLLSTNFSVSRFCYYVILLLFADSNLCAISLEQRKAHPNMRFVLKSANRSKK